VLWGTVVACATSSACASACQPRQTQQWQEQGQTQQWQEQGQWQGQEQQWPEGKPSAATLVVLFVDQL
jgi:hypothetical protein